MKWQGRRSSSNVEDRRGMPVKGMVGGGLGIGSVVIFIVFLLLGGDPSVILNNSQVEEPGASSAYVETAKEKELADFSSVVLAETETVWTDLFQKEGSTYAYPKLVLYTDSVASACGVSGAAAGPFYCPGDRKVYIDLDFFDQLQVRFKAPGDFAMAYVIAHEVGHHVQNLLGIEEQVMAQRSEMTETEFNAVLVRMELQADYFAGVWAHYAERMSILEKGDLEEALTAASAVGDDTLQKAANGYTVPDSFTHGTSEQRSRWFMKGYQSGTIKDGDTFSANPL